MDDVETRPQRAIRFSDFAKLSGGESDWPSPAPFSTTEVLIIDEATSSLDMPREKKIQEAISRLEAGRTTFAIAHRLTTLRSADRLVVLDAGKVVEIDTRQDLMQARRGISTISSIRSSIHRR